LGAQIAATIAVSSFRRSARRDETLSFRIKRGGSAELDREAGRDRDRPGTRDVNLTGQISARSIALSKVMSLEELEALEAKMLAAMEAERTGKVIEAPTTTTNKPKEPRSGDAEAKPLG
jgi:hypothetical protein